MNAIVELSQNRKTGQVSATYAPRQTCPHDCRLLGKGCYGDNRPCVFAFNRITRQAQGQSLIKIAKHEARGISQLSGRLPLRLHVTGDCTTAQCAREISRACWEYTIKHGCPVWSYTHAWRKIPKNAWGKIHVFASCESILDVEKAHSRAYPTALILPELPSKCVDLGRGLTGIPCTEQQKGVPCVSCRLCFQSTKLRQRGQVVLFRAHGSGAKKVKEVLQ
jgi:hypothetical protein